LSEDAGPFLLETQFLKKTAVGATPDALFIRTIWQRIPARARFLISAAATGWVSWFESVSSKRDCGSETLIKTAAG
jgi:hypothetical protein